MKKLLFTFALLFTLIFVHAQNEIKARIEFEEAEKAFEAQNFESAIQHVSEAEKLIGSFTPKTGFLKIESLYAITDIGFWAAPTMQTRYEEVTKYMVYMNKQKADDVPAEKYSIIYEMENILKTLKLEERQSAEFLKA